MILESNKHKNQIILNCLFSPLFAKNLTNEENQ